MKFSDAGDGDAVPGWRYRGSFSGWTDGNPVSSSAYAAAAYDWTAVSRTNINAIQNNPTALGKFAFIEKYLQNDKQNRAAISQAAGQLATFAFRCNCKFVTNISSKKFVTNRMRKKNEPSHEQLK